VPVANRAEPGKDRAMRYGLFTMPQHPPERDLRVGHEWDLAMLTLADELGYVEAWVGEHHTCPWEPHPSPDLLIAQAFNQTKQIRLGPGGFLLPFHHPAELANRLAMLDHISGGRLNFGVAASSLATDWAMFDVDGMAGQNRDMTRESLEIILKLWSADAPFEYRGKYWTVRLPEPMFNGNLKPHIRPVQRPHPPIGVAGLSKKSDTLKLAGERGFLPMSLNLNASYLRSHWQTVAESAARAGRSASRADWRLAREVFVAESDDEAWDHALNGMMGRMSRDYILPLFEVFKFTDYLKHDPSVADSDVTPEYLARHNWLIGSPRTVVERIECLYEEVGGFGCLLQLGYDYLDRPEAWNASMRLFAREVMPRLSHLKAA
jgi:alkanesulfonate monooxygenase SsuD/methylene tetrahydromethanopterin reductase-like flavin-dependent oxidoreductase (luciferase family)